MRQYPTKRGGLPPVSSIPDVIEEKDDEKAKPDRDDEEIIKEALERYEQALSDDEENRSRHRDDFNFVYTPQAQTPTVVRAQRDKMREPCLEFNQLPQFVHQVVNDQRQNRPGIRIHPAGGEASEEVAEIQQGMIREIEYSSQAQSIYDTGFEGAVVGGRGWWRVCTEYEDDSFDQVIRLKSIKDSLTVIADNQYSSPDGGDRRFVFVTERMPKDAFKMRWPKADPVDFDEMPADWGDKDTIVVADYYRRQCKMRTLVMMSDRAMGWLDKMPKPPSGVVEVARREAEDYTVEWFKIAGGQQVLEEYKCPGKYIPVICTTGDDILIDGKRSFIGLIANAKDPQRMLNYGMTQQAVHLALTPRAPWVVAAGQVERYAEFWKNANTENYAYLPYDPVTIDGMAVPAPQRTAPSMPDAGWRDWTQQMVGMVKSSIGMYENSLGQRASEVSGRAIIAREKQGDNATFHLADNLARAIELTGRIVLDWIPPYYDTERIIHIVGLDGTRKSVTINQQSVTDENGALQAIELNNVKTGRYAVTVESGPSYATKRQESADKLSELVKAFPPLMQSAADVVIRALDIPDAEALAERAKLMMPPQVQQAIEAESKGQKPPDPATMQKMMQMGQQLQQLQQAAQQLQQENQQLKSGAQMKMQAAQMDAQTKMQTTQMDAQSREADSQRDAQVAIQKAQSDAQAKIEQARLDGQVALQKASMERDTKLRIAIIERATALELQQMQIASDEHTARITAEEQARQAEGINQ